jgi:hypothetical protein
MTGSGITPGDHPITIDAQSVTVTVNGVDVKANYEITIQTGILRILPLPNGQKIRLVITPADYESPYTGELIDIPMEIATVTHGGQPIENFPHISVEFTLVSNGIEPGAYPIRVRRSGLTVTIGGVDVRGNYELILNRSTLTILPPLGPNVSLRNVTVGFSLD